MQTFDGATAISSNAYFGRDDEEDTRANPADYSSIEGAAREMSRQVANFAGEDLENVSRLVGQGIERASDMMRQYMR